MVSGGGLNDSWCVSGSGVSLFFHGVKEINFLISSGIIGDLLELLWVFGLSILEALMSVTRSNITSYFSPLSVHSGDKYVTTDMSDFQATLCDCSSATYSICRQDSGNQESIGTTSSFSFTATILGIPEVWVILRMPKMPLLIECFGHCEGGGNKTVKWSPYVEELDSSNSSSFELMPTEHCSVRKEVRCTLPVRDMVLD